MLECPDLEALEERPNGAVADHIAACASCGIVVELLAERKRSVEARVRQDECARFEMLLAVREEGTLGGAAGSLLDVHLRDCPDCQAVAASRPPANDHNAHSSLPAVSTSAYALGREVARGGMGRILAAEDLRIGRRVAVKELLGRAPALATRFEREARVTARLQHPGIVPIYEIGQWPDGTPFYSMRMVEGRTLRDAIRERTTLDERLALLPAVIAAAEAVAFAHTKLIIHRDLTPNNILVGAHGDTVVIDWGLAKDLSDASDEILEAGPYRDEPPRSSNLTAAGAVIGTAAYMPPEQARGERVDQRADVYALGAILYHLIASTAPYAGRESADVLRQVQHAAPRPIEAVMSGTPRDLASIVQKAMAREPADRYADAAELVRDLRRFQTGLIVESHHYTRRERLKRWVRHRRVLVVAVLSTLIAVGVVGTFALRRVLAERDRATVGERAAIAQRHEAVLANIALLEEQGRQELLRGNKLRALVLLAEAYEKLPPGQDSRALRLMLRDAGRELASRERTLDCSGHVERIAVSADEKLVAGICEQQVRVWSIADGALVATVGGLGGLVGVAFAPDNARLVTWRRDAVHVWNIKTAALIYSVRDEVAGFKLSRDGTRFVTVGDDGAARLWDAATGRKLFTLQLVANREPVAAQITPKGKYVVVGAPVSGRAAIWDTTTGAQSPFEAIGINAAGGDVSDDRLLVCGERRALVFALPSRKVIATLRGHSDLVVDCKLSPDGTQVLTGSADGTAKLWDIETGQALLTFDVGDIVKVAFAAGGARVITVNTLPGIIKVWATDSGALLASYDVPHLDSMDRFATTSEHLITANEAGQLLVQRGIDGARQLAFVVPENETTIRTSADGGHILSTRDGSVSLWNTATGSKVELPPLHEPVDADLTHFAAVDASGKLVIRDFQTGGRVAELAIGAPPTRILLNGPRVVVMRGDASEIWDISTGQRVWEVPGMKVSALDPTGHRVVAWSDPKQPQVWDVDEHRKLTTLQLETPLDTTTHRETTQFDQTGSRVMMLDGDYATLWDIASSRRLVRALTFSWPRMDSARGFLTTVTREGVVTTFRVADGALVGSFVSARGMLAQPSPDGAFVVITKETGGSLEVVDIRDGRVLTSWRQRRRGYHREGRTTVVDIPVATWTPDGAAVVSTGAVVTRWDATLETASALELKASIARSVRWQVKDGGLAPIRRVVRGRITHGGQPAANATVSIDAPFVGRMQAATRSADDGSFSIDVDDERTYLVMAHVDNVAFAERRPIEVTGAETTVDIELDLAGSIAGIVVDSAGKPLAGVHITAESPDDRGETTTGADGRYTIGALAGKRSYALHVFGASGLELAAAPPVPPVAVADGKARVTGIQVTIDVAALAGDLDLTATYRIESPSRGRALGVTPDGKLALVDLADAPRWKLAPIAPGHVRLMLASLGDTKSLDGPQLADTGAYSGQAWKLRPEAGGLVRMSTAFQTDATSLDADALDLVPTSSVPTQLWRLVPVK